MGIELVFLEVSQGTLAKVWLDEGVGNRNTHIYVEPLRASLMKGQVAQC